MKTILRRLSIVLLFMFSDCNDDNATGGTADIEPQPDEDPPSAHLPGCSTTGFAQTSDVDSLPGGIWHGSLID